MDELKETGIKDCNGIEMKEGDVVKYSLFGVCQVVYSDGVFALGNELGAFYRGNEFINDRCEIIGSIYEGGIEYKDESKGQKCQ